MYIYIYIYIVIIVVVIINRIITGVGLGALRGPVLSWRSILEVHHWHWPYRHWPCWHWPHRHRQYRHWFTGIHHPGGPSLALATPRCDFRRFRVDLGTDFSGFSRLHRASDLTRSVKGRTSVFAGRRSTFKGSQTSPKKRKSTKIDERSL